MKKFLKQVADYYIGRKVDFTDYTFVFPNKRSAMFMRRYLKDAYRHIGFMPKLTTITAFAQEFSDTPMGQQHELLFNLYIAYCRVLKRCGRKDQIKDFDNFAFWGNVLLNDFNDVDAYMVDAKQLFKNVKAMKEIAANYLTPEQIEVARILGDNRILETDEKHFWQHIRHNEENDENVTKFLNLWEILYELYVEFNRQIEGKGIAYSGKISREAYERIKGMTAEDFNGRKYVFVGFYILSNTRLLIFDKLRKLGVADFFWDVASPMLSVKGCKAGEFILPLAKKLPMPNDFELEPIDELPEVHIYPVPSNVGQTKVASSIIAQWNKLETESIFNPTFTGVVLPNEKLLMPMLYSVPPDVKAINVAMRVSFNNIPLSTLLTAIFHMQERAQSNGRKYFYKDVLEVLAQPIVVELGGKDVDALKYKIGKFHLYNIAPEDISPAEYPQIAFIFQGVANRFQAMDVHQYVSNLIAGLRAAKLGLTETKILNTYQQVTDRIFSLVEEYGINMMESTYFSLMKRMLMLEDMQFEGDPVRGLQIMGMRDSRVLDFDNLCIMSLNERIMPKRNYSPSLIPPALRAGYMMPTIEHEEITLAYQFYRIISRARRLCLLYDSRTPDLATGEISRYLVQLKLLFSEKIKMHTVNAGISLGENRVVEIVKDESVMRSLRRYLPGAESPLNFSASTLKTYINCPLQFYLLKVKGLSADKLDLEYIDPASYGQVAHKVAELFYTELQSRMHNNAFITADDLDKVVNSQELLPHLERMAHEQINIQYYRKDESRKSDPLPGEARVLSRVIALYVKKMLECEWQQGKDFKFYAGEDNCGAKSHNWAIDPSHKVNFTLSIDRIDMIARDGNTLRFIDYKTGSDTSKAPTVDDLFTNHEYGAIFQLLLYCMAYNDLKGTDYAIKPVIYNFKDIGKGIIPDIQIGEQTVNDYHQLEGDEPGSLEQEFRQRVVEMIDEIFDPEKPFRQTEDENNCKYCTLVNICQRYVKKTDF